MSVLNELKALMLRAPRLTLATAESMTCGLVQAKIGELSGASEFFLGGITAYTLDQKVRHLAVKRAAARRVNCVSAQVAEEMARGACALFDSDLGVATTGYAEPSEADGVAEPFAWWALAHRRRPFDKPVRRAQRPEPVEGLRAGGRLVTVRSGRVVCPGAGRAMAQRMVAEALIAELLEYLAEIRGL